MQGALMCVGMDAHDCRFQDSAAHVPNTSPPRQASVCDAGNSHAVHSNFGPFEHFFSWMIYGGPTSLMLPS